MNHGGAIPSLQRLDNVKPVVKHGKNDNTTYIRLYNILGCPLLVTVTTRIVTFLVGDPYKPSFATGILGGGTTQIIYPINKQKTQE